MKREKLKARGIRFTEAQWNRIVKEAARDKSGSTKPSDIVRFIIDKFFTKPK